MNAFRGTQNMPVRLSDDDAARFVLSRGLVPLEALTRFRAPGAGAPGTLFERLASAGFITAQHLAELERNSPASAPAPPRPASPPATNIFQRRTALVHAFDEDTAPAPPGSATVEAPAAASAAAAPRPSGSQPARAMPFTPAMSGQHRATGAWSLPPRTGAALSGETEAVPAMPPGWPGGVAPADSSPGHVQQYLMHARQAGASDLYVNSGLVSTIMVQGELRPVAGVPALSSTQVNTLIRQMMTREQWEYFERSGGLTFCYAFDGGGRYRATVFKHRGGCDASFRVIAEQLPPLEQLGLPENCARLAQAQDGLVLIASPAGSGKTTTMLALVDQINRARRLHIVTLEEPVEYLLPSANSRVTQREVGSHAASYEAAFQAALREDADLLVFGELRDDEVVGVALGAAEAGLLVFATVQALDCGRAIDRLLETSTEPWRRRDMVADNLRAVFCQQLIRRAIGQGRTAACEMLVNSVSVANIIRDGKTHNLVNVMQTGRQQGMLMLDDSLRNLLEQKMISVEEAYARSRNRAAFKNLLPRETKPEAPRGSETAKAPAGR